LVNYIFKFLLLIILYFSLNYAKAQSTALLYGTVQDSAGDAVANANIEVLGLKLGTLSDEEGKYDIVIPTGKSLVIRISYLGNFARRQIPALVNGEEYELNVVIASNINLTEVNISEEKATGSGH